MRYYVLFSSDGWSAEGDFEYHDTLEDAVKAAQEILEADQTRSADDYYITAIDPDPYIFPKEMMNYDIYGNEF